MYRKNTLDDTANRNYVSLGVLILVAGALIGGTNLWSQNVFNSSKGPNNNSGLASLLNTSNATTLADAKTEEQAAISVAKNASPAVVSIVASEKVSSASLCKETEGMPSEFRQYFNSPGNCPQGSMVQQDVGAGSGFIVSSDGYIITNKHVVQDPSASYTVILNDSAHFGQKYAAKILARAGNTDLAVIKIDAKDLPSLSFGDSDSLEVGQTVMAIGYALGEFDCSVSKGIVSGLSRSISAASNVSTDVERLRGLIQTDAAINPGDSGGPLLDLDGKVVGVDVAMADGQNIGFAIPSKVVKTAYDQLRSSGKISGVEHAFLGVRYLPINTELQSTRKLPYDHGMLVVKGDNGQLAVQTGSPAEKAGLVENDIILSVDGKQLNTRHTLSDAIDEHKPGDTISLLVYHGGKEITISVQLASVTQ